MKTRTRRVYVTLALSVLTVIVCANSVLAQSTFRRRRRQSTATTTTNGTAIVNQTAPTDPTDPSATVIISDPTSVSDPTSPETAVSATTTLSDTAVSPANASLPAAPVPFATSASGEGLLSGATVDSNNHPSMGIPDGWQLVIAQGFESGVMTPREEMYTGEPGNPNFITPVFGHGGSHSLKGKYTGDGSIVSWYLTPGNLSPFSELYISYWDYVDPNGKYANSDYFMLDIGVGGVCGQVQDFGFDAQNYTQANTGVPTASATQTWFVGVSQGNENAGNSCQGIYQNQAQPQMSMNAGFWRQYEFHYKPSTATSGSQSDNVGDGEAEMYVDGKLFIKDGPGVNLNGTQSMNQAGIQIGGVITSFDAYSSSGARCYPFGACIDAPTPFNRYIDDIIIFKK